MTDVEEIERLLTRLDIEFRTAQPESEGVPVVDAIARVGGFDPATQTVIRTALLACRDAISTFDDWDARFHANVPDNFTIRVGESPADLAARRQADRDYIISSHPGREGRRQEAGVAYRVLPSCELAMGQLLADQRATADRIRIFADQLIKASAATRAIIEDGIGQPGIKGLRRQQVLAYYNMAIAADLSRDLLQPEQRTYTQLLDEHAKHNLSRRKMSAGYRSELDTQIAYIKPGQLPGCQGPLRSDQGRS